MVRSTSAFQNTDLLNLGSTCYSFKYTIRTWNTLIICKEITTSCLTWTNHLSLLPQEMELKILRCIICLAQYPRNSLNYIQIFQVNIRFKIKALTVRTQYCYETRLERLKIPFMKLIFHPKINILILKNTDKNLKYQLA